MEKSMDKIIALAKSRGFVYQAPIYMAVWQIPGIMAILA